MVGGAELLRVQAVGVLACGGEGSLLVDKLSSTTHQSGCGKKEQTCQAWSAVTACLLHPAKANAVADLEVRDARRSFAELSDSSNSLVAETHVVMPVVLVGAADTTVGEFDESFGRADVAVALSLDDAAIFGALVDGEVDTHCCGSLLGVLVLDAGRLRRQDAFV